MRVLILGGTREARILAARLVEAGHVVTTSLAGRTTDPRIPAGDLRIGGFGGVDGLADALDGVDRMVDASHPFAVKISVAAWQASTRCAVPLLHLVRPPWRPGPEDRWIDVPDLAAAPAALPAAARTVFLAVGTGGLTQFKAPAGVEVVARVMSRDPTVPPSVRQIVGEPLSSVDAEAALFQAHRIDALVAKNAGGPTDAKFGAARRLGLPVVMVRRPALPPGPAVDSVDAVLRWIAEG